MDTPDPHPAVPSGTPAGLTVRGDVGRRLISAAEFRQLADVPAAIRRIGIHRFCLLAETERGTAPR